jgi:hypothetical protein
MSIGVERVGIIRKNLVISASLASQPVAITFSAIGARNVKF